ncbi:peptide ABC transporter substrate-binding protein [uncultured Brevibacillus sp.]|uniref:peptide ABC transporter substrate-binding protein n=1 Tax=uncultured Brevibacillus sp. TaxID=169970 RepID=UPI002593E657|nr:peptide ABC transporter substrate-binding protein [uncultured Brevibacillus sp.]
MKKVASLILSFTLLLPALAGCGGSPAANTGNSAQGQAQTEKGTASANQEVVFNAKSEPPSLDPVKSTDIQSFWIINHMFEGLYWKDQKGEPVLAAAKDVKISEDGKTYTFILQDEGKWSNGDPVTSDDFVYSFLQHLDPKVGSTTAYRLYYIKGAEEFNKGTGKMEDVGVKAVDAKTLEINLVAPTSFFPKLLATQYYVPIHKKTAEANPSWAADASSYVTNGPYKMTSWKHDSEIVIEKNEHYWNQQDVSMQKVTWKMVSDATTYYQMFKGGQLDVVSDLTADILASEKQNPGLETKSLFGTYMYLFNVSKPPFTNQKVRQAFALAIDRKLITEAVTRAGEIPAYAMVPPGASTPSSGDFRAEKPEYVTYNPEEAKRLLEEGMKEEGWTTFPETTLLYNTSDANKQVAQVVQEMIKKNLGLELRLENQELKMQLANLKQKNYQMARGSWTPAVDDPVFSLDRYSGDAAGDTAWVNDEYVKLKAAATVEPDANKRNEMLHQAEEMLMRDMPFIPVYFPSQNYLVQPGLKGLSYSLGLYPIARWATRE